MKRKIFIVSALILMFNAMQVAVFASAYKVEPTISASNAIVMNVDTGEVLYSHNADEKVQIASTTKLMTALLLAENRKPTDIIKYSVNAMNEPSTSVYKDVATKLTADDEFKAKDVMNGLLLKSGNDMAVAIAEDIAGDSVSFSKLMDSRAIELGMNNTDFYTVSGLDTDDVLNGENHYSTAYDMAILGIAAYKNEWVRESMGLKKTTMSTEKGYSFEIENSNKNLGLNGNIGGKTGFTTKAGRCLVSIYSKGNNTYVGVVLGGGNPSYFNDMNKIVDYASSLEKTVIYDKNKVITEVKDNIKSFKYFGEEWQVNVPVYTKEDIAIYDNEFNKTNNIYSIEIKQDNLWNIGEDNVVGELVIKGRNSVSKYTLYTDFNVKEVLYNNRHRYIKYAVLALISCGIGIGYIKLRKNKKQ